MWQPGDEPIFRAPADPAIRRAVLRPFRFDVALMGRWPGVVRAEPGEIETKWLELQPRRIVVSGEGFDQTATVVMGR